MYRFAKFLIFVLVVFVLGEVLMLFVVAKTRPEIKKADAIIILGAAINTPALTNRTLEGLRLYKEGKANVLILSGGKVADPDISEAEYMQKIIKKNSDPKLKINYILEDQSHNTYENILNSLAKVPNAKSVIIVSDEYHLARGVAMAKSFGVETVYWSAPKPTYYDGGDLSFYYFREFVALINYIPKFMSR